MPKIAHIEVKNLKEQDKPYGTDFVRRHILSRAEGIDGLKLLVITFLNLTKLGIQLLQENNWVIIEVGERLTYEFYRELNKLYKLSSKIKTAINFYYVNLSKLTRYIKPIRPIRLTNITKLPLTNELTHDTPPI
jgi:hypothetical protein